jgi:two-component system NtrC family sensor kinase
MKPASVPATGRNLRLADRRAQIAWFNRLRTLAVGGVFVVSVAAYALDWLPDIRPVLSLASCILLVNMAYVAFFERLGRASERTLRRHVDLQIAVDLVLLTSLLHYSGGITNPFVLFYTFHTFIASLLRSSRAALLVALVSSTLVAALGVGEWVGLLPHHPIAVGFMDLAATAGESLAVFVAVFAATQCIAVYFLADIMRQLGRREAELGGLHAQLGRSEKLAAIGTLASGVAHEINNPVSVIKNRVQILRYRISDGDDRDSLLRELDVIDKHGARIGNITQGLLTFAKETPFELRRTPVNALVREAADLVRVPFTAAKLDLVLDLDPGDPEVLGSGNHLLQVLINVLLNAKDASAPGAAVQVGTSSDGEHVRIAIVDRGTGIPPEHLPKIFDPFFTTKDVDRGTGLGLAISHGIVERHGGRMEVASELGAGTRFTVVLRAAPATLDA